MKFKRKRKIKLKKQYFDAHNGNPFDSRSICTSEIVKTVNELALENDVRILEIKDGMSIGMVHIITKACRSEYDKFCQELINELGCYLKGYSI